MSCPAVGVPAEGSLRKPGVVTAGMIAVAAPTSELLFRSGSVGRTVSGLACGLISISEVVDVRNGDVPDDDMQGRPTSPPLNRRRRWAFRGIAVLLGLSLFVLAELVCMLFGWGTPVRFEDPLAGFPVTPESRSGTGSPPPPGSAPLSGDRFVAYEAVHPLFVLDESGMRYGISPSRRAFFAEESFPAVKQPGTFRVFCLGGSTVQGRPFSTPTSFTTWLQLSLAAAAPTTNWEVINCGGISYASYRLMPILAECLTYQPDLIIVCTGHNEFLEDRTYAHIKRRSELWRTAESTAARLRTFQLLRRGLRSVTGGDAPASGRPVLRSEVDALLDYRNGLDAYHRDDEWRAGVVAHFESNLRQMVAMAGSRNVPVMLMLPPSNLRDCPPFKSEPDNSLPEARTRQWQELRQEAQKLYQSDLPAAAELLREATSLQPRDAATQYELGQCLELLGQYQEAKAAFIQARDEDICPLRMITPLEKALGRVAATSDVPLIDSVSYLEARHPEGLLGDYLLIDHVHPTVQGHQKLGTLLAETVLDSLGHRPAADWSKREAAAFRRHEESLDDLYYLRGMRMLENLRAWTKGRADGPSIRQHVPPRREAGSQDSR